MKGGLIHQVDLIKTEVSLRSFINGGVLIHRSVEVVQQKTSIHLPLPTKQEFIFLSLIYLVL